MIRTNDRSRLRLVAQAVASAAVAVGFLLLIRVAVRAATGSLMEELFPGQPDGSWQTTLSALALSLPVPFHVMSVGLLLQKRWLSPAWAGIAWYATVISGCCLGVSLAIKLLVLQELG